MIFYIFSVIRQHTFHAMQLPSHALIMICCTLRDKKMVVTKELLFYLTVYPHSATFCFGFSPWILLFVNSLEIPIQTNQPLFLW